jgi:alpha-ketoglutarate-dependent taurine dioxygenase
MSVVTTQSLGIVGAELAGVHPDHLLDDPGFPAACMASLEEHGVLVFRGLDIDDETQIEFSRRLDQVGKPVPAEPPRIFLVTLDPAKNPVADYLRGTFFWHIDGAQDDTPTKATMLSAHVVAVTGGETEFASTYRAYEDLTDDEKIRLARLRVVHSFETSQRLVDPDPTPEVLARWRKKPDKVHPLIWEHRSGRRSLVIGASADHVAGMDRDEGKALLGELLARATAPDRVYRHQWRVGDLVMWDNTGVLHRACPYEPSSTRELHRTTMSGDEPIR